MVSLLERNNKLTSNLMGIHYEFKVKFTDGTETLKWAYTERGLNWAAESLMNTLFEVRENVWYNSNSILSIEYTGNQSVAE